MTANTSFRQAVRHWRDLAAFIIAPVVEASAWRRNRLLVLGYHGVSLDDEHIWDSLVYMAPETFRRRMTILQEAKYAVLPLAAAFEQLYAGTLPARAIALVFDDGFHDFSSVAAPILSEFGYPATVYLSTYYSQFNRPIFDIMLGYLLWKGKERSLLLTGILQNAVVLDSEGRREVIKKVHAAAFAKRLTGYEKDRLLAQIANALDIDYEGLCRKRLFQTMNAEEVRAMKARGYDIQLHTHRHRVSRDLQLFQREIHQNRKWIQETIGGPAPVHFSFPGGVWEPVEREWLVDLGIETAITCIPGLVNKRCDRLRIPRFVDNATVDERTFRAWLAGSMTFFPRGPDVTTPGQVLEETIDVSGSKQARAARV